MWDTVSHVLTAVLSAAFVGAVAAAYVKVVGLRHRNQREVRRDEFDALREQLKTFKTERDRLWKELEDHRAVRDKEISDLRSEYTAVLIQMNRCEQTEKYLREQNADLLVRIAELLRRVDELLRRVAELEAELAELRG